MEVADRIRNAGAALTISERRVAGVIVERPHLVGFGTVADLAAAAGTGAATVVRLATKLGYRGFSALQDSVQSDLANQLRPAAERIREHEGQAHDHAIEQVRATEVGNVNATLDAVDADELVAVVARLADLAVDVLVVAGDAVAGVAGQFVADLHSLRHGVVHLTGNDVARQRELAFASSATTVVAIDLRRYDRWVLDATRLASDKGMHVVALTDNVLSPLAALADHAFVLSAASVGPFDSQVGTLALLNALIAGVADELRPSAVARLDQAEQAWTDAGSLTDGDRYLADAPRATDTPRAVRTST